MEDLHDVPREICFQVVIFRYAPIHVTVQNMCSKK